MKLSTFFHRHLVWHLCIVLSIFLAYLILSEPKPIIAWFGFILFATLSLIGLFNLLQTKHAVLKNYPVAGLIRFWMEAIRPEIRQYLIESDTDKVPFSRNQRAIVYQRAKNLSDQRAFGTLENVYAPGYEWLAYANAPSPKVPIKSLHVEVGGNACTQPYAISIFNISAMSFGSLSANAILALNKGAKLGGFAQDTGEGSVSPYHRKYGGDLIWEIGSGYFGCRTASGHFDLAKFTEVANDPQIKMIEIKLSQGAKPGHGGVLPAAKITPEIAKTRDIPLGKDCVSPHRHTAFHTPIEFMHFLAQLRLSTNGKPIGFKLCIGQPENWFAIVKAMLETGITPDFIVVDGSEGGTGAAPVEFIDHVGMPMRDALRLIHSTLVGVNLRSQIRLGAAGKIISAFDVLRTCAIGADWCNSARGFMFAIGCIQSRICNTDRCPTGVATQNLQRQKALDPLDKGQRVAAFHRNTLKAVADLLAAASLKHPSEVTPNLIMRRNDNGQVESFATSLLSIEAGSLLTENTTLIFAKQAPYLTDAWLNANPHVW